MLKFNPPMLNNEVCRVDADTQSHKNTYIVTNLRFDNVLFLVHRMGCRCFWDSDTDNYAQDIFMNVSFYENSIQAIFLVCKQSISK